MIGGGPQKITVEIGGKIAASLGAALRGAQTQVSSFGRNVNRSMNDAAIAGKKGFSGIFGNALWQQASIGAAGIGLALAGSVRVAARFESVLADVGKTANVGEAQLKKLSAQVLQLSGRNVTNLGPEKLAQGIQDLVAQGLNLNDAVASMETLGRVATATGSDLLDVTKTGFQLQNALKIRPTELKATFDALAFAGKQGAFELKDMAQFMPTIAAAAGTLGITGKQGAISLAAMMQMVRKDAPDAGQASTRLTDAMLKMTAPDAVKRFKKFGVNIEQVLTDAKAKGINPMEAALDQLQAVTGGDVFKLGQIFGDKEAKLGLMSLMKYRKEYQKLKADAGGAAAAGTVDQDFERSIKTLQGTLISFQNSTQRLGVAVGNSLLPPLTALAGVITPLAEGFAGFAASNPRIATGIVLIVGALAGLVIALPIIAGVVQAIGTIKLALAGLQIGATIAGYAGVIGPAMGAIVTAITGPIGIAVLAIIGIGLAFKAAYDKIPVFRQVVNATMQKVGQVFTATWTAIKGGFQGFITWVGGAWKMLTGILTFNPARISEGFNQAFNGIKQIATSWLGWMDALWPGFAAGAQAAFAGIVGIAQQAWSAIMGAGLGQFVEGIKAQFSGLATFFQGAWGTIVGIFTLDAGRAVAGVKQAFGGLDQIGAGLMQTGLGLGRLILTGIVAGVRGIGAAISGLGRLIVSGLQAIGALMVSTMAAAARSILATWRALPGRIIAGLQTLIGGARSVFDQVVNFIMQTPARVANVGKAVMDTILNGLKSRAGALFGWIRNTWSNISALAGGGAAPASAGGAAPAAASSARGRAAGGGNRRPPGRALGGPVTAGMPYIVGEKRRELFVPGMDGAIIPRVARPAATPVFAPQVTAPAAATPKTPPININPPVARQAPAPAPITINAPVTINATGDGAGIRDQVRAAFADLMAMASSGYRVALND